MLVLTDGVVGLWMYNSHQVDAFTVSIARIWVTRIVITNCQCVEKNPQLPSESPLVVKLSQSFITTSFYVTSEAILVLLYVATNCKTKSKRYKAGGSSLVDSMFACRVGSMRSKLTVAQVTNPP